MKNPYVTVIGHCDDTKFPIDPFKLFSAAMKYHVLLEINNSSLSPEGYRGDTKFTDLVILNCPCTSITLYCFPVTATEKSHVGDFTYAAEAARLAKVPRNLILNPLGKITVELPGGEIISGRTSTSSPLIK